MLFNSPLYGVFLVLAFAVFWLLHKARLARVLFLITLSYGFYYYGTWDEAREHGAPLGPWAWALLCLSIIFLGLGILIAGGALLLLRRRAISPTRACLVGFNSAFLANAALCLVVYSGATGSIRSKSGWLITMVIVWPMALELVWIFVQTVKTQPSQSISPVP